MGFVVEQPLVLGSRLELRLPLCWWDGAAAQTASAVNPHRAQLWPVFFFSIDFCLQLVQVVLASSSLLCSNVLQGFFQSCLQATDRRRQRMHQLRYQRSVLWENQVLLNPSTELPAWRSGGKRACWAEVGKQLQNWRSRSIVAMSGLEFINNTQELCVFRSRSDLHIELKLVLEEKVALVMFSFR